MYGLIYVRIEIAWLLFNVAEFEVGIKHGFHDNLHAFTSRFQRKYKYIAN